MFVTLPPELNFSMSNFYEIDLKSRHVFFRLFFVVKAWTLLHFYWHNFILQIFYFTLFVDENLFYSFFLSPTPFVSLDLLVFLDLLVSFRFWRSHVREGEKEKRERERESALAGVKKLSKKVKKTPPCQLKTNFSSLWSSHNSF